jgi:hypothetical protein
MRWGLYPISYGLRSNDTRIETRRSKSVNMIASISTLENENLNPNSGVTRLGMHQKRTAVPVQEIFVLVLPAVE